MIAEKRIVDLLERIKLQGGTVLLPHPFRRGSGIFRNELRRPESFLRDAQFVDVDPLLVGAVGGVRLQVLAADEQGMFRMVESPAVPSRPVSPDRPRLLWVAVFAALGLGLAVAGIAEWLDASVRGPEDVGALGAPVLAAIPRIGPAGRA